MADGKFLGLSTDQWRAIQGAGEGFAGRGAQWQAATARERDSNTRAQLLQSQQQDEQRKNAMQNMAARIQYAGDLYARGQHQRAAEIETPAVAALAELGAIPLPQGGTPDRLVGFLGSMSPEERAAENGSLQKNLQGLKLLSPPPRGQQGYQVGETGRVVKLEDDSFARSIPVFDRQSGKMVEQLLPLGGDPVNDMGLTPEAMVQFSGDKAGAAANAKGTAGRAQETIDIGIRAAREMPRLRSTKELLEELNTGGFAGAALKIKNFFGIEGADEAELTNNLAKSVLSQLRDTFGAQFTEREGAKLQAIEAGIGKSTEGNKRIIDNLIQLAEIKTSVAMQAAERTGDPFAIQEMRTYMNAELGPESPQAPAAPSGGIKFLGFE
ncbi:MAG: hypothetical protein AAF098_13370 [Pseudomonadota bacterium]